MAAPKPVCWHSFLVLPVWCSTSRVLIPVGSISLAPARFDQCQALEGDWGVEEGRGPHTPAPPSVWLVTSLAVTDYLPGLYPPLPFPPHFVCLLICITKSLD